LKPSKEFELLQNTFIANQNQYRDIVSKYIKERRNAYIVAIVMFFLALAAVIVAVITSGQVRVQAMIFDKDGQYIGAPNVKTTINDKAILVNQLSEYITFLYSVPGDLNTKKYNVTKVVAMTDSNYFSKVVLPIIKDNLTKYQDTQVMVKVNSIIPLGDNRWTIEFSTYVADHLTDSYKTILSYKQDLNLDSPSKMINNPLGIYITSLETQEKIQ
jgi:type IV secretory pathway TrbF-like protein